MTDTTPPETPPLAAPPRRLTRSTSNRVVGGVCGGLADYTGVDPIAFRILIVVASFMGGAGVLAYALAWALIPEEGDTRTRDRTKTVLVTLLIVALLPFGIPLFFVSIFATRGIALILVVGALIWYFTQVHERHHGDRPVATAELAADVPHAGVTAARPPRMPKERSKLTRVTLSVCLLVGGGLALLDTSDAVDVSAGTAFAVVLLVVAAGLLIGSFYGRGRGLILVGIPLGVMTFVATATPGGGFGERTWQPASVSELNRHYRLTAGEATLDLSRVGPLIGAHEVNLDVGFGDVRVILPNDVDVELDASVGAGDLRVGGFGDQEGRDRHHITFYDAPGDGLLVVHADLNFGEMEVQR